MGLSPKCCWGVLAPYIEFGAHSPNLQQILALLPLFFGPACPYSLYDPYQRQEARAALSSRCGRRGDKGNNEGGSTEKEEEGERAEEEGRERK